MLHPSRSRSIGLFLSLSASLSASLLACGDDAAPLGSGGAGGAETIASTGTAAAVTGTVASSGTGEGGEGGAGTGGIGSVGTGQGGQGEGGAGTGGSGDGGGGGSASWFPPSCTTVEGTPAVTFTTDEGATVADRAASLSGVSYASSIVALDTPGTILVASAGVLQRSTDAGCTFEDVGALPSEAFAELVAAPGGKAYGWSEPDYALFVVEGDAITDRPLPNEAAPQGMGVDPDDGDHVRLAASDGSLWESFDGGGTWERLGGAAPEGCFYTAVFDPSDLDHVVCGTITSGTWFTTNAGETWTRSESDVLWSQTFTIAISPVDGDVVWIEGHENGLHEGEVVGVDRKHVWRSIDGGATFVTVLLEDDEVDGDLERANLYNGNVLVAHPTDPDVLYYLFGVPPRFEENYGALYRVDAGTGEVTVETQAGGDIDDYGAMTFNPADPSVIYLALTSERPSDP